ncbi:MAG: DUF2779 domain-containing protein [Gemmatimonadota bacterium]
MPTTKRSFLSALTCPTMGWYEQHAGGGTPAVGLQWRFFEGNLVQRLAREWLGEGTLLPSGQTAMALEHSRAALDDPTNTLLFEASFAADGAVARADALRRTADGWELIEIKAGSSRDDTPLKPDHIDDVAYTWAVLTAAGVPLTAASLVMINADHVEGSGSEPLTIRDATAEITERAALFRDNLADVAQQLAGDRPAPTLIYDCRHCDHFGVDCMGVGIPDPLFDLPGLRVQRWDKLISFGERISELPVDADLTDNQAAYAAVLRSGTPAIDSDVLKHLDDIAYPIHYLDFEAIQPALPWFAGTSPYQKHPFQYSLHVRPAANTPLEHHEYLALALGDWRREFAESLLTALGERGSILVYSSYESQVLNQLAAWFPDLESRIDAVRKRLFDLEKVVKKGYLHPAFRGKSSIKKVLPVVAPDLSYDGLDVAGGEDAMAVFGFMYLGEYPTPEHARHRAALLEYCKLDTAAMVRVHEALVGVKREA